MNCKSSFVLSTHLYNWSAVLVKSLISCSIKLVSLAILLLLSVYFEKLRLFAASGIAIMMLVAIYMHFSVGDELIKSMPASVMLLSCLTIVFAGKKSN